MVITRNMTDAADAADAADATDANFHPFVCLFLNTSWVICFYERRCKDSDNIFPSRKLATLQGRAISGVVFRNRFAGINHEGTIEGTFLVIREKYVAYRR